MCARAGSFFSLIEVRTRIPKSVAQIIGELIKKGYFSSMADFARQAILDKLLEDYEIGIEELEPEIVNRNKKVPSKKKKG